MTRCPACSAEIETARRFCPECGSALDLSPPVPTQPAGHSDPESATRLSDGVKEVDHRTPTGRFAPGTMITRRYRIVSLIGRGGMGEVYRADDLKLGQPVAIKFLPADVEHHADRLERLLGEVRSALKVTHPNVCRTYDVGEVDGRTFLTMEYVDGEDLASLLLRIGRLPQDKANQAARELCAGLAAAHDAGILHRDLKPANIMLDGRGRVRITDFGLAGAEADIDEADVRVGTPAYMSPEQLAGAEVTPRSDLYALGLVLYEIYTGRRAFEATTLDELQRLQGSVSLTDPDALASLDPAVDAILRRCLDPDPSRRPGSAMEVSAALPGGDPLAAALAAGETPSPELVAAAGDTRGWAPILAAGVAVLSVLIFMASAWANGHRYLAAYLPLDRPLAVVEDRARELIRELGYTDPFDAEPVDWSVGYGFDMDALIAHSRADRSTERWERLRDRGDLVLMSYRQRPAMLVPEPRGWGTFIGGSVTRDNPYPSVRGDLDVTLDADGRLQRLSYLGEQFSDASDLQPDWQHVFELAGLDLDAFRSVEPRFRHLIPLPASTAAWTGEVPWRPGEEARIEAGSTAGRVVAFQILMPQTIARISGPPVRPPRLPIVRVAFNLVMLFLFLGTLLAARSSLRSGRSDRRGATVAAAATAILFCLWEVTRAHALFTLEGTSRFSPIIGGAVLYFVFVWSAYAAFEPYARRVSPHLFVSWRRLVTATRHTLRDRVVGKDVLTGLVAGACLTLVPLIAFALRQWWSGTPPGLLTGLPSGVLVGTPAISSLFNAGVMALSASFAYAVILGAGQYLTGSRLAAGVLLFVLAVVLFRPDGWVAFGIQAVSALAFVTVLMRFGLVVLIVTFLTAELGAISATVDWSAWYARPTILSIIVVSLLAAYGVWAAAETRPGRA